MRIVHLGRRSRHQLLDIPSDPDVERCAGGSDVPGEPSGPPTTISRSVMSDQPEDRHPAELAGRPAPARPGHPGRPGRRRAAPAGPALRLVLPRPGAAPRPRRRAVLVPRSRRRRPGRPGRDRAEPTTPGRSTPTCRRTRSWTTTGPRSRSPTTSSPRPRRTPRRCGGRRSPAAGGWPTATRYSCTSSPRPPATQAIWTPRASSSTVGSGSSWTGEVVGDRKSSGAQRLRCGALDGGRRSTPSTRSSDASSFHAPTGCHHQWDGREGSCVR